jgi:amino acid adenylation domain-containing protein
MTESPNLSSLSPEEKRAMLADLLKRRAGAAAVEWPLSHGQRALWFLHRVNPSSAAYNLAFAVTVRSELNAEALKRALQSVVARHATLRSTIREEAGDPKQVILPFVDVPFDKVDATGWDEDRLQQAVVANHRRPFDLERGPVIRAALFSRDAREHVLLISVHHLAFDGWSLGIVADELRQMYAAEVTGVSASLPPVEFQYGDFVDWQRRMLATSEGTALEQYWASRLASPLPVLSLPTDRQRPAALSDQGETCNFTIAPGTTNGLEAVGKSEGAGLFATLLTAFQMLLARYANQEQLLVGAPTAGRSRAEFERVVGYFVNPVVLRGDFSGNPTFRECLRRVHGTVQGALAHQDYPFPLLVEQLHPHRDPSRSPVFQVMFNLHRAQRIWGGAVHVGATGDSGPGQLPMTPYAMPQEEGQFDLSVDVLEIEGRLVGTLKYSTDLFERATIERMIAHLEVLLEGIVAEPDRRLGDLPMLTDAERRQLLEWSHGPAGASEPSVIDSIEAQVSRNPAAVAVSCAGRSLTYAELSARANQLAWRLRALGVGPDVLVGIGLERSVEMVVAALAVLKAGGAYLPLDPAFPPRRLAFTIENAGIAVLITQESLRDLWLSSGASFHTCSVDADRDRLARERADAPPPSAAETDLAYVIYTSGSTGQPKGVAIPRRALASFLESMRAEPGIQSGDVLVAVTTLSFDIAGLELLLPLTAGAEVVVATRDDTTDGARLAALLESSNATMMQATPATWRLLLNAGWTPSAGLKMLCGGEPMPPELAKQLVAGGRELWNMYGPTETTIWSSVERVSDAEGAVAIGRPIRNTTMYVLDRWGQPMPVGMAGELYIGGAGVARGYWRRPELTAERFVPDPVSRREGDRIYRAGDGARFLPDGRLECLGRIDDQVKVRGFRIELGEIEAVLERHPAVAQAVASVQADASKDRRLVAYVAHAPGEEATASELRRFLRQELPDYMVPSLFVPVESLPLTPNGKVDRGALPNPFGEGSRQGERVAPRTPTEQAVASIWAGVLDRPDISIHDNFFDIGGHSLLSMEAIAAIEKQIGVRLNPAQFMMDTLEQISAMCDQMSGGAPDKARR